MNRAVVLWALLVVAGLTIATPGYQGQPDEPRVAPILSLDARENLYSLGGGGANSVGMVTDDGVVLVDTKLPGWGPAVGDAIAAMTDKPVTVIINTHSHADHTGSNNAFPSAVEIVAHERTKANMEAMEAFRGGNARFLPNRTFKDRLTLKVARETIELYYFGSGHTDGDAIVVFPRHRLAFVGDLFPGKSAPLIDASRGGSGVALPETLAKAVAEIKGVDRVITGHDPAIAQPQRNDATGRRIGELTRGLKWSDLQEYAQFTRDFLTAVQDAVKAGKSADQATASLKLPERYKDYDMRLAGGAVQAIFDELNR